MQKAKKSNSFRLNKENVNLPKELMSNPITQKIRIIYIDAEKFGRLVRAKALPEENANQRLNDPLSEREDIQNIRQSVIVTSEKPIIEDIRKMSLSILEPGQNSRADLRSSRCSNMSKSKSVRFSEVN